MRLLDLDPDLGTGIDEASLLAARARLTASVEHMSPGRFTYRERTRLSHGLGFIVLDGLLAHEVVLAGVISTQIIGPGDLIAACEFEDGDGLVPHSVVWTILQESRLAVLDEGFLERACSWPGIISALAERTGRRTQRLAIQQAIGNLTGLELRLTILFWQLAERWGRVGRDGVLLPLRLSHAALGRLIGAKRPSVTTALAHLLRDGVISAAAGGGWVLHGDPAEELDWARTMIVTWTPPAIAPLR